MSYGLVVVTGNLDYCMIITEYEGFLQLIMKTGFSAHKPVVHEGIMHYTALHN